MPDQTNNTPPAEAAFVVSGKVIRLHAAMLEGIPADNTLIFKIDQVITAPAIFGAINGMQVTIRFNTLNGISEGSSITVHANGWIYGESLALDAVSFGKETDSNILSAKVQAAGTESQDAILKERLDAADLGVVGQVLSVDKSSINPPHISEHDPDWHEATIAVDEVVKGSKDTKEVKVLFPHSDDVRWYRVHKYAKGQNGIWILHKGKSGESAKAIPPKLLAAIPDNTDLYTTLHPSDFLPLSELSKVKSLLP